MLLAVSVSFCFSRWGFEPAAASDRGKAGFPKGTIPEECFQPLLRDEVATSVRALLVLVALSLQAFTVLMLGHFRTALFLDGTHVLSPGNGMPVRHGRVMRVLFKR
jgi:flagellar biosynthesis protein FliP